MDIDALRKREIPYWSLVDGQGISVGGSSTLSVLFRRGMESTTKVTSVGVAGDGSTLYQLQARGIQCFCELTENGIDPVSGDTATQIAARGISGKCPVDVNGIAQSGSATIETLRKRSIAYFCPLDETGTATTLGFITLSASTIPATATIGTTIGTLAVVGGIGVYTFTLTSNPGGLFSISGTALQVGAALTQGSDPITIKADNGAGSVITQPFLITVTGSFIPTFELLGF